MIVPLTHIDGFELSINACNAAWWKPAEYGTTIYMNGGTPINVLEGFLAVSDAITEALQTHHGELPSRTDRMP